MPRCMPKFLKLEVTRVIARKVHDIPCLALFDNDTHIWATFPALPTASVPEFTATQLP